MASTFNRRLSRLVTAARAAIVWERLWPALAPMVGVLVLFVASAWMGLWLDLPAVVRAIGLGVFAVLFIASGWRLVRLTLPGRADAMRRLETDAHLDHRPLAAYEDELAPGGDAFAERVWRVHRERAEARLSALKVPLPNATLVPHDPYAMRSVVGLVLFVGLLVGAGALAERLITPFDFSEPAEASAGPQFRLDAWVTPPSYTGRSPLFLSAATRVETADGIRVPSGSVLTVRSQGVTGIDLYVSGQNGGGPQELTALSGEAAAAVSAMEGVVTIDGPMAVEVRQNGETVDGWRFVADADLPPTARFTEAPQNTQRNAFELRYELDDDYGIASAEAVARPVEAPLARRPLVEDPTFALTLPGGAGMRGAARTVEDLTAHPYAGREVELTLHATDGLGQTGNSRPETFRLPARTFTNPVAKAIIEQRAKLAMDANAQLSVIDAIDLIMLDPDTIGTAGAFLAVNAAYHQLVAARSDDALREVLSALWEVALLLEDDGLSDAERALKAAQERLRQALEDGASEEEIARLTRELREAMQEYMRALARQMENQPQQQQGKNDPNAREITQSDLDKMLQRIEELAKEGRQEEAEALLSELQQMMQNLQMAQRGQGQPGQQGQSGQSQEGQTLEELGRMIQRQQELMDETYGMNPGDQGQQGRGQGGQQGQGQGQGQERFGRGQQFGGGQFGQPNPSGRFEPGRGPLGRPQPPQGGQGQPGQPGEGQPGGMSDQERAQALRDLGERQSQLRRELGELMQRLEDQGFAPGDRMGDAERSMGDAGEALGDHRAGEAVTDQADALQALREGAQSMAQQLAEAQQQQGDGNPGDQAGPAQQGPGRDPLGRARREGTYADTSRVGVPDEIESQRARRILQELRERLGDMTLPRLERDYLERLIP